MFGRRNPRSLPPFQKGELSSSKLNSLRIAASKRIRGLFGRESASSASTSPSKQQSLRERLFALNNTGQSIPAFSIFAVKKSGDIDYAWGPPVHTEGNKFEHGFVYYTNGDFEIANGEGHWCQVIGDLPTMIRSAIGTDATSEETKPKIGHPIGPLEDGTLSVERCGYVVVAEPWAPGDMGLDENYVWVTKANDQAIRVKLKEDINQRKRGKVCVLPAPSEDLECDGCTRDTEPGVYTAESCTVKDPNTIAPDPGFEIRKVINLTRRDLKIDQIVYIHPVLGIGYAILETDPGHYKAKIGPNDLHHLPAHDDSPHCAELMVFDAITEDWINVLDSEGANLRIGVWDRNRDNCVLIGEMHDVLPTFDKRGCAKWHWVGQHGLTREVEIQDNIQQGASGIAFISKHENELCPGIPLSDASITICNKGAVVRTGDIAIAYWLEDVWVVLDYQGATGTIAYTQLTDRTREISSTNNFGRATVLITEISGTVPNVVGDIVEVIFVNKRRLEAVTGCQGRADYIGKSYHVVLAQGLVARFWARTLEGRASGAPDQDVLVEVVQNVGHSDDDYPAEDWGGQPVEGGGQVSCTGSSSWVWNPFSSPRRWTPVSDTCSVGCEPTQPPNPPLEPDVATPGTGGCAGGTVPPGSRQLKVRFLAGTYPRMLEGALCVVSLDNDITNTTDNSGMKYFVDVSDQIAQKVTSTLTEDMCGGAATVGDITVASVWPFSQKKPGVISIPNPKGHYGITGDDISAFWNEAIGDYEVFDVDGHLVSFTELSSSTVGGCTTIGGVTKQARVELCDLQGSPFVLMSYRQQTVTDVVGVRFTCDAQGGNAEVIVDITQYQGFVSCDLPNPTAFSAVIPMIDVVDSVELTLTTAGSGSQDSSGCADPLLALLFSTAKAIGCGSGGSGMQEASRIVPEKATVLVSYDANGCPMWVTRTILILPGCSDSTLHEATCGPCPQDSGSEGS